jgi:broad specificity phosphatase PhoE
LESAAPVCERLGLETVVDPRLTEFDLGITSVESVDERPDLLVWRPEHTGADGETLGQFSVRVAAFCEEVVDRHPGERVVVVSHAGTIEATLRWSMGIAATSPWTHEFEIANASITEIELWPRGRVQGGAPRHATLKRVGDVAHLDGLVTDI